MAEQASGRWLLLNWPAVAKRISRFFWGNWTAERGSIALALAWLLFFYFLARLVYFAVVTPHHLPPDETSHFQLCQLFAKSWFFPVNSDTTLHLGDVEHTPWLYYYLLGRLLQLNLFSPADLLLLRIANAALTCGTVVIGMRWLSLLTPDPVTRLLFLVVVTNIPMVSFLGASVNYDNLANICAAAGIFSLHRFYLNRRPSTLLGMGIALCAGALTKISFLPLALIVMALLLYHERTTLPAALKGGRRLVANLRPSEKVLAGILLLLFALVVSLYGTNLAVFQRLTPPPERLFAAEELMQQRILARNHVIDQYRTGGWSALEAQRQALAIPHPGDQRTALVVLENLANSGDEKRMGPLSYAWFWSAAIFRDVLGIAGHRSLGKTGHELLPYQTVGAVCLLLFLWYCFRDGRRAGVVFWQSVIIVVGYSLFLMYFHNYSLYRWSLTPELGLQGRYLFPVLVPAVGIATFCYIRYWRGVWAWVALLPVAVLFVFGDFPYYLRHVEETWHHGLDDGSYYRQRGEIYRRVGENAKAMESYRMAVERSPDNPWFYRFIGDLYSEQGKEEQALAWYRQAIERGPEIAGFYYLAGRSIRSMGGPDEAIRYYLEAVRLAPRNFWYRRFLADLYRDSGNSSGAVEQYRAALEIDPDDGYCHRALQGLSTDQGAVTYPPAAGED